MRQDSIFDYSASKPRVYCKAFEDNSGALELAKSPKLRPRTKHINIKYHHFHDSIENGRIMMYKIDTLDQEADIFTKPLEESLFIKLRKRIMGWLDTKSAHKCILTRGSERKYARVALWDSGQ